MSEGWIKLHRKLVDWEWYTDNPVKIVFIHLLLTVNHSPKKWRGQTIEAGEKITSYSVLSDETGLTVKQVRLALQKLESTQEVECKRTNRFTLVKVLNYGKYQAYDEAEGQAKGTQKANRGQTEGTQRATNKNEKNVKNDKKIYIDMWNSLPDLPKIQKISGARETHLNCRIEEYGSEEVIKVIQSIADSDFLLGKNNQGWCVTFDWLIKDSNFKKVAEGNYRNRKKSEKLETTPTYDIEQIKQDALNNTEI